MPEIWSVAQLCVIAYVIDEILLYVRRCDVGFLRFEEIVFGVGVFSHCFSFILIYHSF